MLPSWEVPFLLLQHVHGSRPITGKQRALVSHGRLLLNRPKQEMLPCVDQRPILHWISTMSGSSFPSARSPIHPMSRLDALLAER